MSNVYPACEISQKIMKSGMHEYILAEDRWFGVTRTGTAVIALMLIETRLLYTCLYSTRDNALCVPMLDQLETDIYA